MDEMEERADDMDAFRVIVADDDPLARRMIRSALQDAGFVVVAEARNGREAVELTQYYGPDAVLMDVVMPELDGISATRRIISERPDQLVILLTGADEEIGLAGLQAGASGYLNKDVDIEALPRALRGAAAGEAAISRTMGALLIQQLRRTPARPAATGLRPVRSALTPREWEVLDLLCTGYTPEDVADTLVLSHETVRSHLKRAMRKLGVRSRGEAIEAAARLRGTAAAVAA
jgi:two-component system, NarL family, response regulator LiaR